MARRARWFGLAAAPDVEAESAGQKRQPILLDIPGYSGAIPYDDAAILHHICDALYTWREKIFEDVQSYLAGTKEDEFDEAMMLAELVIDRNNGLTEVELAEERNEPTASRTEVWRNKRRSILCRIMRNAS